MQRKDCYAELEELASACQRNIFCYFNQYYAECLDGEFASPAVGRRSQGGPSNKDKVIVQRAGKGLGLRTKSIVGAVTD